MGLAFGDLELDLGTFELRRAGRRVPMEPQAFDVLVYLAQHRDRVVSKEELMDQVWGGRFVSESAVTSRIKQVRRAVGDDGQRQSVITTLHGRGYRFVAPATDQPRAPTDPAGGPLHGGSPPPRPIGIASRVSRFAQPRRPTPRVGRAQERARLRELLDEARAGHGGLVLVGGEPGIGKTELLTDLLEYAGAMGAAVLTGRAVAGGGTYRPLAEALAGPWRSAQITESPALAPFRAALGRILPGWSTPPPVSEVDPVVLLGEAVVQVLLGLDAPVRLLALEDVHHADPDTIAVLEYLAAATAQLPVLVVGTHRDWPRPPGLDRLSTATPVSRLGLSRLPADDAAALVDALVKLPDATRDVVVQRSEGLPLVVVELVDSVASQANWTGPLFVPKDFAALIDARLAGLATDERRVLAAAAVLGQRPNWELVAQVAGVETPSAVAGLEHAVQVHLLALRDGELRWRHGLVRHAVWATVLPPQRQALSRAAAELLLSGGTEESQAAAAELLSTGGDVDRAADVWLRLSDSAVARGALRTAAELLQRAADTGRRPAAAAMRRVELLTVLGRAAEALQAGRSALDVSGGDEHAELCLRLARAAVAAGEWAAADDFVALAGRAGQPGSLIVLADSAHGAGRIEAAVRLAQAAVERARDARVADVRCDALCCQARILRLSDPSRARAAFAEAVQVASEHGMPARRLDGLFGLGTIELLEEQAPGTLVQARRLALDLGLVGTVAQSDVLLAEHAFVHDGPNALPEFASRLTEHARLLAAPALRLAAEILLATGAALTGSDPGREPRVNPSGRDPWHDERAQLRAMPAVAALAGQTTGLRSTTSTPRWAPC